MDPEILSALRIALSSALIGFAVATTLYGITCVQAYLYYRTYPNDSLAVKIIVVLLWTLDTIGSAGIAHTLYYYLINDLGKSDIEFIIPWSYAIQCETVDLITLITQCFFAWQIWKVGKNAVIVTLIILLAIAAWALDIVVVFSMFKNDSGLTLADPVVLISGTTVQGIDALCDILITASFIYYLHSFRTGIKTTEKIIDNLILYAVSRGFLTVVAQIVFVSLDAAFPGKLYWLPFQQSVGKLYVNSVLASLNSRKAQKSATAENHTHTEAISVSRGLFTSNVPVSPVHFRVAGAPSRSTGAVLPMSFTPNTNADAAKLSTFTTSTSISEEERATYFSSDSSSRTAQGMNSSSSASIGVTTPTSKFKPTELPPMDNV